VIITTIALTGDLYNEIGAGFTDIHRKHIYMEMGYLPADLKYLSSDVTTKVQR